MLRSAQTHKCYGNRLTGELSFGMFICVWALLVQQLSIFIRILLHWFLNSVQSFWNKSAILQLHYYNRYFTMQNILHLQFILTKIVIWGWSLSNLGKSVIIKKSDHITSFQKPL